MRKLLLSFFALLLVSAGIYAQTAPVVDNPIADVDVDQGFGSTTVDLTGVFSDPNGDALILTALSDDESVVTVGISGLILTITEVGPGTANVTVTASDGAESVQDVFVVHVNASPVVAAPLADLVVDEGFGSTTVDLSGVFSDPDGDLLGLTATSGDGNVVTVSVSGNTLTITEAGLGTTNVTVTASDGSLTAQDVFSVHVNASPVLAAPLADQNLDEGFGSTDLDLTGVFSDPDGDLLGLTATSGDENVVTVSVSGNTLTITEVNPGTTNVTVTASDGSLTAQDVFSVDINAAPVLNAPIADQNLNEGFGSVNLHLLGMFSDPDGDLLELTAVSGDENVVTVSFAGNNLTLTEVGPGTTSVTVTASDGSLTAQDVFSVHVNASPVLAAPLADLSVDVGFGSTTVDLTGVFSDPDGSLLELTASSDDETVVTVSVSGNTLTITEAGPGTANVTVTASDGSLTAQDVFSFHVNAAPVLAAPLADLVVDEGFGSTTVDLTGVFSDPDGDLLELTATSDDENVVTVSVSGNTLTITEIGPGTANVTVTASDGSLTAQDVFSVHVNASPVLNAPLADLVVDEGFISATVDLTGVFSDPDGDLLELTATSDDGNVVTVSVSGNTLTITEVGTGTANVTVTASDQSLIAQDVFSVHVNASPVLNAPLADLVVDEGFISTTVDLTGVFSDPDGDLLELTATSDDGNVLTVSVSGNILTITEVGTGTTNVTVTASDQSLIAQDVFSVHVNAAPVLLAPLADLSLDEYFGSTTVDLTGVFSDPDGDLLELTASSDDETVVTVSITDLTLTITEVGLDTCNITVNASDGSLSVNDVFMVVVNNVNDAPVFTVVPDTVATEDVLYASAVAAIDIDGDSLIYRAPLIPAWLSFNDTTHILSGTPANEDVGDHNVTLRVTDGTILVDTSFVIHVENVNDAPVFTVVPDTAATEDVLYTYAVAAIDVDGDSLIYRAPLIPAWLSFNDTTHILSGTPANEDVGDHNVTLRINDGTVNVDTSFVIHVENVNDAPVFTVVPDTAATEDLLYSYTVAAIDVDGDSLIYRAPLIPAWLSFNDTTHILSGTPANEDVGDHNVTLRINDGTILVDTSFVIHVENVNDAPGFLTVPDTMALQDALYSYGVTALDIDGDTLTFSAPVLPDWLSFNDATNVLSGTPANADVGDHNVTLRINDGTVNVDTSFVIHVENVNDPPAFTSVPEIETLEDLLYTYTVAAEDIDGDALTFTAPVLPLWLTFNATTHVLSGTPDNDDVGNHNVVLAISDGIENEIQSFVLEVINTNDRPTVTSTPITEARPGVAYTYTVTAIDVDGDPLSYTAIVLPGWLTFNASTHTLSATPGENDIGDQFVTIRVSDGSLYTDHTFIITVSLANHAPTFTSEPGTSVRVGETYEYTMAAQDIDDDPLSYSAPDIPDWLTYYPATHVISGVPQSGDIGRHDITLEVSDGTVSAQQSFPIFVLTANSAPAFSSTPVTSARAGELYFYNVVAEDADEDDLEFTVLVLPGWLSFDVNTQTLFGTPGNEDAGDHNVSLRVSDGESAVTQNFVITVEPVSGVGMEDIFAEGSLVVYPNPTDGLFFVKLSGELDKEIQLEILDPLGKILFREVYPPYSLLMEEFNLSDRPAGIYFIRLYHDSSQAIRKVILR